MNTTTRSLLTVGLTLTLGLGFTATALAGPPNDAGFKARGMKPAIHRNYVAPQLWTSPTAGRQAFSYQPQVNQPPLARRTPVAPAPAPAVSGASRRFSYEPATPAPVYRTWTNRNTGPRTYYGGGYPSKANLKY